MPDDAKNDDRQRLTRRLAVMLGQSFVMGDLGAATEMNPAAVDAEADDYEGGSHALFERWGDYVEAAREFLDVMLAAETTRDERAAARRQAEEAFRAELRGTAAESEGT